MYYDMQQVCEDERKDVIMWWSMWSVCVQHWFEAKQIIYTVRVSVHQSEDGDVQRVPKFSHHQPAVHVRHTFTLTHMNVIRSTKVVLHPQQQWLKKKSHLTVIMMQGDSFVQKSSSSSLWNVASFSTIMTNFADDTISECSRGKITQTTMKHTLQKRK